MLTNKYNLPSPIVRAIENDGYDAGNSDITVTQLIGPPMIRYLRNKYRHEITEDAISCLWRLLGQCMHTVLERGANSANEISERRLYVDAKGWKIGGQFDLLALENGILTDYKLTSVYSAIYPKQEWHMQLQVLGYILRANGYDVKYLQSCLLLRDWRPGGAQQMAGYPDVQFKIHHYAIQSLSTVERYINERLELHGQDPPRLCTVEERWRGRRCRDYCDVAKFCKSMQREVVQCVK